MDEPEAIIVVEVKYLRGLEARVKELEEINKRLFEENKAYLEIVSRLRAREARSGV